MNLTMQIYNIVIYYPNKKITNLLKKMKESKKYTVKERIIHYLKESKITQSEFCKRVGLSSGYIGAMRKSFQPDTINKIVIEFPDLDITWLLTGEGEMLKNGIAHEPDNGTTIGSGRVIPYYDAEVAAGTEYGMEMMQTAPVGVIEIGGLLKDSEFAMRVYGNSMVPNYPAGCVIGLRQYNEHFIEPGTVYVIETEENRFLKRLYYSKDKKAFRCMSDNHMKHENGPMEGEYFYPEFEIPFEDVRRLLRVTGVIKRNIL